MYIFGIGLNKTGTTSLDAALGELGYQCIHDAPRVKQAIEEDREAGRPILSGLMESGYDAFCDSPVWQHWRELDETYADARFILTTRPFEDWYASRKRHIDQRFLGQWRFTHWEMDEDKLRARWEEHERSVRAHFEGREDFLVLEICAGEGWERLCEFLGKDVPAAPFPWKKKQK